MSEPIPEQPRDHRVDRIEWAIGYLSALIVIGMLGFLTLHGVRATGAFPDLMVAQLPGTGDHLRFAVVNRGALAASNVTIALRLDKDSRAVEKRILSIDFVPAHSQVSGAFLLRAADRELIATLVIESYLDP